MERTVLNKTSLYWNLLKIVIRKSGYMFWGYLTIYLLFLFLVIRLEDSEFGHYSISILMLSVNFGFMLSFGFLQILREKWIFVRPVSSFQIALMSCGFAAGAILFNSIAVYAASGYFGPSLIFVPLISFIVMCVFMCGLHALLLDLISGILWLFAFFFALGERDLQLPYGILLLIYIVVLCTSFFFLCRSIQAMRSEKKWVLYNKLFFPSMARKRVERKRKDLVLTGLKPWRLFVKSEARQTSPFRRWQDLMPFCFFYFLIIPSLGGFWNIMLLYVFLLLCIYYFSVYAWGYRESYKAGQLNRFNLDVVMKENSFLLTRPLSSGKIMATKFFVGLKRVVLFSVVLFLLSSLSHKNEEKIFILSEYLPDLGLWLLSASSLFVFTMSILLWGLQPEKTLLYKLIHYILFILFMAVMAALLYMTKKGAVWVLYVIIISEVMCLALLPSISVKLLERARHSVG